MFDTIVAGWLLRPSFPDKTLADLVDRYLDEKLPEADPTQLVPETEGATPGAAVAWFTLRVAPAAARRAAESVAPVLTDIELPTLPVLADMELAGVAVAHAKLAAVLRRPRPAGRRHRAGGVRRRSAARSTSARPSSCRRCSSKSCSCRRPARRRPATRRMPRCSPTCRRRTRIRSSDLLLQHREATKLRQIIESLDKAIGADGRIRTTYCADRQPDRAPVEHRPEPAEHPDPHGGEPPHPQRRSRSAPSYETLLTADYSQIEMRIMAHLSEDPGLIEAFNSGEDLHRFVGARVFGVDPEDVTPRCAPR